MATLSSRRLCDDEMRFRASAGRFRRADYKISGETGGRETGSTAFEPAKILWVPSRRYRILHRPDATGSSCGTSSAQRTPPRRTRLRTPSLLAGGTFAEAERPAGTTTRAAATTPAVSPPAPAPRWSVWTPPTSPPASPSPSPRRRQLCRRRAPGGTSVRPSYLRGESTLATPARSSPPSTPPRSFPPRPRPPARGPGPSSPGLTRRCGASAPASRRTGTRKQTRNRPRRQPCRRRRRRSRRRPPPIDAPRFVVAIGHPPLRRRSRPWRRRNRRPRSYRLALRRRC